VRPCLEPGCPNLVERGRCEEHAALDELLDAIYADRRWSPARLACFTRDGFRCDCGYEDETRSGRGLHAHHLIKLRAILERGLDPFDPKYLATKCGPCHNKLTARGE
jgi:hypothetical protein